MISKQEALAKEIAEKIPQQSKVISDLEIQLKKQEEEMEAMMAELQEKEARIAELAKSNNIPDSEKLLMSALSDMETIRATKMPTATAIQPDTRMMKSMSLALSLSGFVASRRPLAHEANTRASRPNRATRGRRGKREEITVRDT